MISKKLSRSKICIFLLILMMFATITGLTFNSNDYSDQVLASDNVVEQLNNYAQKQDTVTAVSSDETQELTILDTLYTQDAQGIQYQIIDYSPASYKIYAITDSGNVFIEGSDTTNSIYYMKNSSKTVYYGGAGDYYELTQGGRWHNLLSDTYHDNKPTVCMSYNFNTEEENNMLRSTGGSDSPIPDKTNNVLGYTCISNHTYFRNLKDFPDHPMPGSCGVVAVAMLLGYYDYNIDDNYITDHNFLSGTGTSQYFATYLFFNWVWNGLDIIAEGTIMGVFDDNPNNNIPDGFPMAAVENKVLINKYTKRFGCNLNGYVCSSNNPITNIKKHINEGRPIIGTTSKYSIKKGTNFDFHNVIMYGYKNDTFLCHMGWDPGYTSSSAIQLTGLSIHSFYGIK